MQQQHPHHSRVLASTCPSQERQMMTIDPGMQLQPAHGGKGGMAVPMGYQATRFPMPMAAQGAGMQMYMPVGMGMYQSVQMVQQPASQFGRLPGSRPRPRNINARMYQQAVRNAASMAYTMPKQFNPAPRQLHSARGLPTPVSGHNVYAAPPSDLRYAGPVSQHGYAGADAEVRVYASHRSAAQGYSSQPPPMQKLPQQQLPAKSSHARDSDSPLFAYVPRRKRSTPHSSSPQAKGGLHRSLHGQHPTDNPSYFELPAQQQPQQQCQQPQQQYQQQPHQQYLQQPQQQYQPPLQQQYQPPALQQYKLLPHYKLQRPYQTAPSRPPAQQPRPKPQPRAPAKRRKRSWDSDQGLSSELETSVDEKAQFERLAQAEDSGDDRNVPAEAPQPTQQFDFDLADSEEEGCIPGNAGQRRMRKPKVYTTVQAALGPNIVTESRDVLEGAEHLLFVKTYCPYGTFEGRLRDLGVAKARSVA